MNYNLKGSPVTGHHVVYKSLHCTVALLDYTINMLWNPLETRELSTQEATLGCARARDRSLDLGYQEINPCLHSLNRGGRAGVCSECRKWVLRALYTFVLSEVAVS